MYSNLKKKSYKLDIYLIEPTKKLEGIVCQSITFTNTLKRQWGEGSLIEPISALNFVSVSTGGLIDSNIANTITEEIRAQKQNTYLTPIKIGDKIIVQSPTSFWTSVSDWINENYGASTTTGMVVASLTSKCFITTPDQTTEITAGETKVFEEMPANIFLRYTGTITYAYGSPVILGQNPVEVQRRRVRKRRNKAV